jgi:hypothetical protein
MSNTEQALINRMASNFFDAVMTNDMDTMCSIGRSLGLTPNDLARAIILARRFLGIPPDNQKATRQHLQIVK